MGKTSQYRSEKLCTPCGKVKKSKEFRKIKAQYIPGWKDKNGIKRVSQCLECERNKSNIKFRKNPFPQILNVAKRRAKRNSIPFEITHQDIKDVWPKDMICPALGIKMNHGKGMGGNKFSPSLDRLIPEKGYVKGNIIIVSYLANRIKSDASLEEIEKTLKFYRRFLKK